jgi:hypothetical protein
VFDTLEAFVARASHGSVTPLECQSKSRTQPDAWNQ